MIKEDMKLVVIILGVFLLLNCGPKSGKPDGSKPVQEFGAQIETLDSMTVASLNRTGPYSGIGNALKELNGWLEANNVTPAGAPFVLYYDSPQVVPAESCNWAVCIPVPQTTPSDQKAGVVVNKLPAMDIAWTIHTGGYDNVQSTYDKLLEWIDEEGYEVVGPAVEFFSTEENVPVESMKTKIGFVVQPQPDTEMEEESEPAGDGG